MRPSSLIRSLGDYMFRTSLLALMLACAFSLLGQDGGRMPTGGRPDVRLPNETAGLDAIVKTLVSAFDDIDILALGESHQRKFDSDLRIALVRHPEFAKAVHFIVVEFA